MELSKGWGFKGPECLACGGIHSKVTESGFTTQGWRLRKRRCLDCDQRCASVEFYIDPAISSYHRLNPDRIEKGRENDYAKNGKGVFRVPRRWAKPDDLRVKVWLQPPMTPARAAHASRARWKKVGA